MGIAEKITRAFTMSQREKELNERLKALNEERHEIEAEINDIHHNDMEKVRRRVVEEHKKYLYRAFFG